MVLPCLPPPPLVETQANCIAWLGIAHSTVNDFIRAIRYDGVFITTEAEELLTNLREWLYFNYHTERARRRDRRRREVCCAKARFCHAKYENVRKQLHYNEVACTIDVMSQTSSVHHGPSFEGPFTTL
ncbi:E4 control protein orf4 [Human mastadenovirus B]|uniref:E4 control protein orf4 n=1 Tax=Human mastadenovirus B TaxID=108098 RepID=T2CHH1_9ADEN|nr:E4 control protein orf4 [Human mastadenovirus B]